VLAAVHAARAGAIRAAQLDDVDLGNRRLIIAGRVRPIDEFTHQVLLDWLGYRRTRWPDTANLRTSPSTTPDPPPTRYEPGTTEATRPPGADAAPQAEPCLPRFFPLSVIAAARSSRDVTARRRNPCSQRHLAQRVVIVSSLGLYRPRR
jgi:hypothetical protein